jgi:hypothetical protein
MWKKSRLLVVIAVSVSAACGANSPVEPSARPDYAGLWKGPTSRGGTITFTVSSEQRVVAISVHDNLNGCSGTAVLSGLSLEVARPRLAPGSPNTGGPFDNPSFGTGTQGLEPSPLGVSGSFTSGDTAIGVLTLRHLGDCGSGVASWTATKRSPAPRDIPRARTYHAP